MRHLLALALMLPGAAFAQTTDVLWYHGNGGANAGSGGFGQRIDDFGGDLVLHDDWANIGSLSAYRFVVISRPTLTFDSSQVADLSAFIEDFGVLVLLGDSVLGASPAGIDAMNALTHSLSLDMSLVDEHHLNPDNECLPGTVVNQTPFLDFASPLNLVDVGDIVVGANAEVIQTFSIFIPEQGVLAFTMMARQGLTLLTADYESFTADGCGIAAKEAMWENIWDQFCDRDQDGDRALECAGFDCNDTDPTVGGSFEWFDLDGDGFGDTNSPAPCIVGAVDNSDDCDDTSDLVNPDQPEVCDGIDNDCDGDVDADADDAEDWYIDFDGDGFGREGDVISACEQPDERVRSADDCDDGRDTINPEAMEVCSNNQDDNCDGEIDEACTPTPPTGGTSPPGKGCASGGTHLLGMPFLLAAFGLTRRRERR